ncbi:HEAT repeat domain-containing protein [Labilibaculum euxinus]
MNQKEAQKSSRGYVPNGAETEFTHCDCKELIHLLNSKIPAERSVAARLLSNSPTQESVFALISALKIETKLYPKLEICNSLVNIGSLSIKPLLAQLGQIGSNQHQKIPAKEFKKISYPLPRDIAARTLVRFGKKALPLLLTVLEANKPKQISEAIDAIGFINFYDSEPELVNPLQKCYHRHFNNELLQWKIIRAMSGFPESKTFLLDQQQQINTLRLLQEIDRSLLLISRFN